MRPACAVGRVVGVGGIVRAPSLPSSEQSGAYRVLPTAVGGLREAVALLANTEMMTRAASVGPGALHDVLPDLRRALVRVPDLLGVVIGPACQELSLATGLADDARLLVDALMQSAKRACDGVLAAVPSERRVSARARLALEAACARGTRELTMVCDAATALEQATGGTPVAVGFEDVLSDLASQREARGRALELRVWGALDDSVAVLPQACLAMLRAALRRVAARTLVARRGGDQLVLELACAPLAQESRVLRVFLRDADPRPDVGVDTDAPLARVLAASMAGAYLEAPDRSHATLTLLCA